MNISTLKHTTLIAILLGFQLVFSSIVLAEENARFWLDDGTARLNNSKKLSPNTHKAKNVILFVGDGMGIATVTGARIFEGQLQGVDGERHSLSFEQFPYVALSKTYSANQQTADSAPTMTAIISGVKTNDGLLSLNQSVARNEPDQRVLAENKVTTLLEQAEQAGKATGIVSTARITHATPAATYAHISNRDWEANVNLPLTAVSGGVKDIAAQLVDNFGPGKIGDGIEVVFGGGRSYFLPNTMTDIEGAKGRRTDGRHLIQEYVSKFGGVYVENQAGFDAINPATTTKVLGLFNPSHMEYEQDRPQDIAGEPSLADMTGKAIDILKKNRSGFFLMVEGGRIDHASHAGNAYRTFSETVALSNAVRTALSKVNPDETLIIVTADHSHTLTISGYPKRGNPILGKVVEPGKTTPALGADGKPYNTVSFANGPGYHTDTPGDAVYDTAISAGRVVDMTDVDSEDPDFHQEALVPLSAETHGGEDVAIYATGPKAYLVHGVQEQSYLYQVMKEAFGF
ncbi:alkaline phosphatase [Methylophilus rhizosphaerae]|uniref:Alkaline phosphatase n=1 Tax=Methylophilus rhizosphaerae TaxID=492660 RepID=A0A1G8ZK94_9PROT|nr:alkaline phosphatase [Methylophilus rhizosphaerae]SDK15448.1 alkaline phosphatase [Methylophilus rhizosphaerae]